MAGREVFSIVRKALADLAGTSLEERLAVVFIRRLGEMDGPAKAIFAGALRTAPAPAVLRSAFDLPGDQRSVIQRALNETFSASIPIKFESSPDLVGGIELTSNGQKLAWNIADYLKALEKGVDDLLKQKEKATPPPDRNAKIAVRAYEIYEQRGHRSDSAEQDWSQAEQEIRKSEAKPVPKPDLKTEPKPEVKPPTMPEAVGEPKPEARPEFKQEAAAEAKPESKPALKPEVVAKPKPGVKPEPKPEVKVESKPEVEPESKQVSTAEAKPESKPVPKPDPKSEPKPEAVAEPKPGIKDESKPETESKPEAKSEPKAVAKPAPELVEPEPEKKAS
jgi:hypothetical protein